MDLAATLRLQRILMTIFLTGLGSYLLIALLTYSSYDPGWSQVSSDTQRVTNASGVAGAWIANFLISFVGMAIIWLPVWLLAEAIRLWWANHYLPVWYRLAALVVLVLASASLLNLHVYQPADTMSNAAGGVLGLQLGQSLLLALGLWPATLLLIVMSLFLVTLALSVHWGRLLEQVGELPVLLLSGIRRQRDRLPRRANENKSKAAGSVPKPASQASARAEIASTADQPLQPAGTITAPSEGLLAQPADRQPAEVRRTASQPAASIIPDVTLDTGTGQLGSRRSWFCTVEATPDTSCPVDGLAAQEADGVAEDEADLQTARLIAEALQQDGAKSQPALHVATDDESGSELPASVPAVPANEAIPTGRARSRRKPPVSPVDTEASPVTETAVPDHLIIRPATESLVTAGFTEVVPSAVADLKSTPEPSWQPTEMASVRVQPPAAPIAVPDWTANEPGRAVRQPVIQDTGANDDFFSQIIDLKIAPDATTAGAVSGGLPDTAVSGSRQTSARRIKDTGGQEGGQESSQSDSDAPPQAGEPDAFTQAMLAVSAAVSADESVQPDGGSHVDDNTQAGDDGKPAAGTTGPAALQARPSPAQQSGAQITTTGLRIVPNDATLAQADTSDGQAVPDVKPDANNDTTSRALQTVQHRASLTPLPSLDLLELPDPDHQPSYSPHELERLARLLEIKLQEFNIKAKVVEAQPGPVVTRFELELAPGVKASKITNITSDLARSLSMSSVRVVEVIPGKPYIGIEVPNARRQMVRLIELLQTPAYSDPASLITVAMGKDIAGRPVLTDVARAPHMLVAGTTGSGKSVAVNAMLLSMLLKYTPRQLRLILIDPKQLELANYNDIPHLLTPVVTDMKDAVSALNWAVAEMERRYRLMSFLKVRKIDEFNRRVDEAQARGEDLLDPLWRPEDSALQQRAPRLQPLPMIVIVADEFADMIMQIGKKAEELITRLAQKSRAAGIHLILATQRPSVDVITGLIKANIPTRVALRVNSRIDSRTILDDNGAEDMLGHGDMLFQAPGKNKAERVHGAFIGDDEVNRVCDAWRERGSPDYVDEILSPYDEEGSSRATGTDDDSGPERDVMYDKAVAYVLETRKASISSLQRQFSLGYQRAARLIDAMEAAGLISAAAHNGKREILV